MNILQYPEEGGNKKVQVWNNAAFDGEDFTMKTSWSSSSDCTKENVSPTSLNRTSQPKFNNNKVSSFDEKKIDDEIADIENEIKRLTSRLASLRLEKAERKITSEKRVCGGGGGGGGRVIAAKFMEPKRNVVVSKEETPKNKARVNFRRGMSLGPAEISGRIPPATAPIPAGNRRKSCFWKPLEVTEEERSKTLGSRKLVKKKEETALIQPRNLFKEGEIEKSQSNKKMLKPGRVVASRYNQSIGNRNSCGVEARKRLLPENNNSKGGSEVRVKKRWEIPEEVGVNSVLLLPKIKTLRRSNNESPRDSGAAKRVAELTGKRSYFCNDEEEGLEGEESVCQVLNFAQEGDGE